VVAAPSDIESIFSFTGAKTGKSTKLLQFRACERKNSFHADLKQRGATFFLLIQRNTKPGFSTEQCRNIFDQITSA
jgi:hypothetical protein